eukprot:GHVH01004581.1.p1 GENE.GHVH01004581.1~~GHVH01004581.1.p1  ORF type:complete len:462 (-),score=68.81 GHVH01004581.1:264-1649(-)
MIIKDCESNDEKLISKEKKRREKEEKKKIKNDEKISKSSRKEKDAKSDCPSVTVAKSKHSRKRSSSAAFSSGDEIRAYFTTHRAKVVFGAFDVKEIIGCGSFGMVSLAVFGKKKAVDGLRMPPFCLKSVDKGRIIGEEQKNQVISEHEILQALENHPNVVQLYGCFHDRKYVHYITEFIAGGELFHRIHPSNTQRARGLPVDVARFYFSEVVSVFEYMHERNIVYRDLKPENIMIDASGHIKLVDFGFAKNLDKTGGKTTTICGTLEYLAPELAQAHLVSSKGLSSRKLFSHAIPVDRWALGVFLFELLTATSPFFQYSSDPCNMCKAILKGKMIFPDDIDPVGKDVIKRCMKKDPNTRMGSNGSHIHMHTFFKEDSKGNPIEWEHVKLNQLTPPWKPRLVGPLDTCKFRDPVAEDIATFGTLIADSLMHNDYVRQFGPVQDFDPPDFTKLALCSSGGKKD